MNTVSVIIPTHNRAHTLARALDSVLNQTHRPLEIITVDDGSTDHTTQLVQAQFPAVRLINQHHRGVSAARNTGILAAQGEWIALLDSDDQWQHTKLAAQLQALNQQPNIKLCHTNEIWYRHGVRVNPMNKHKKHGGDVFLKCLPLCCISPSSTLIHRSLFDHVGLFDESLPACEDYDLWLRISAHYRVLLLEQPLTVKYAGHADQLSKQHWGMDRFRVKALHKVIQQGQLKNEHLHAAQAMLDKKIRILQLGAIKHRNQALLAEVKKISAYYRA